MSMLSQAAFEKISVIIPALNEEASIALVLKGLPEELVSQVIVVDNGSTDRTGDIARNSGAQVILEPRRGYGSACLAGLGALRQETNIIAFLDGDYSDFPEELPHLVQPIVTGRADFVLGTRMQNRNSRSVLTPQQRFGNRLAVTLMNRFWNCDYSDLGPFRAIRRGSLEKLSMSDRNFGWTAEMQIKAALLGLRILEVPVHYRPRIGLSKVSGTVRGTVLAGIKILLTIFQHAWRTRNMRRGRAHS